MREGFFVIVLEERGVRRPLAPRPGDELSDRTSLEVWLGVVGHRAAPDLASGGGEGLHRCGPHGDAPSPVGPGAGGARITAAARADGPRLPRSAPRILVIEGNINAGKTTVVDILGGLGCPVVREGVDVWGDILTAFYDNNIPLSQTSWT